MPKKPADKKPTARKPAANKPAAKTPNGAAGKTTGGPAPKGKAPAKEKGKAKALDTTFRKVGQDTASAEMRILCERYPDAECELTYNNDYELLISVILSAQTTDATVNRVTPALFKQFPTPKALAEADLDEVKFLIIPTGYYNAKATNIQKCAQALVQNFGGKVPDNMDDLITLPGVGRKTANVLLGVIHDQPAWTVDTHVQRLVKRLGFTDEADPTKIEFALQKMFPDEPWHQYSITLIWHGRRLCYARNPDCPQCPINHLCPSSTVGI